MENTFYMVYVEGGNQPTRKHHTLELAETEAKRLAKQLNKRATVLCTLKSFEVNEFLVCDLRPTMDDLPF